MAITPNITSPGIEITETDLSLIARQANGNTVFLTGFASHGPTDEIIQVASISEYETIFGQPKNSAERYLYHSTRQILQQSPANVLVSRMPYGKDAGVGFSNKYSALLFPVSGAPKVTQPYPLSLLASLSTDAIYSLEYLKTSSLPQIVLDATTLISEISGDGNFTNFTDTIYGVLSSYSNNRISYTEWTTLKSVTSFSELSALSLLKSTSTKFSDVDEYEIQAPISLLLNEEDYQRLISGDIKWGIQADNVNTFTSITNINEINSTNVGMIIVNPSKLTINSLQEGYYIGIGDNTDINPSTAYDKITGMQVVSEIKNDSVQKFKNIDTKRLAFSLQAQPNSSNTSISQILEENPGEYNIGSDYFKDTLSLVYFKIRSSIYAQDSVTLEAYKQKGFTGSLNSSRLQNNPNGGSPVPFGLTKVAKSKDLKVIMNPFISEKGNWIAENGDVLKTVRVSKGAQNLYPLGVQVKETDDAASIIGNLPMKLDRVLARLDDLDIDIDLIPEAGLGTIWAGMSVIKKSNVDDNMLSENDPSGWIFNDYVPVPTSYLETLRSNDASQTKLLKSYYDDICNKFIAFAESIPSRRDHLFIADPLRYIFVNGPDFKTSKKSDYNHSSHIYWPLKNLYSDKATSYAATYGNWVKINDIFSGEDVWLPSSAYVVADMVKSAALTSPWAAPAGFSRGVIFGVKDLAINPTQKHRDQLYKININPIAFFPGDGFVIFGQKTLFNKPSAFDRINVRRLFLVLEKTTKNLLKYFIFEPNTFSTRARLVQSLSPLFNRAKNNDGLYDFRIICDERNNTPDVIDNNQLKVSIYIQPVRTAEFILADFIATRTGVNFDEITS